MRKSLADSRPEGLSEDGLQKELDRYTSSSVLRIGNASKNQTEEIQQLRAQLLSAGKEINELRSELCLAHTHSELALEVHTASEQEYEEELETVHCVAPELMSLIQLASSVDDSENVGIDCSFVEDNPPTVLKFGGNEVVIKPGSCVTTPIPVTAKGSKVFWTFNLTELDIDFAVLFEQPNGDVMELLPATRCESGHELSCGTYYFDEEKEIELPGTIIFEWDNHFSWFTEKRIVYQVKLTSPSAPGQGCLPHDPAAPTTTESTLSATAAQQQIVQYSSTLETKIKTAEGELERSRSMLLAVEKEASGLDAQMRELEKFANESKAELRKSRQNVKVRRSGGQDKVRINMKVSRTNLCKRVLFYFCFYFCFDWVYRDSTSEARVANPGVVARKSAIALAVASLFSQEDLHVFFGST